MWGLDLGKMSDPSLVWKEGCFQNQMIHDDNEANYCEIIGKMGFQPYKTNNGMNS